MTVIALISDENNLNLVLPWASAFTKALRTSLTVVCWTHSPVAGTDNSGPVSQDLVQAVQDVISRTDVTEQTEIIGVSGPSDWKAAIGVARQTDAELIVAAANDPTGVTGATYPTNPLLKDSPCNTVVLFGDSTRSTEPRRIMVAATDNMNDVAALFLTSRMIDSHDARLTLARAELETEHVGLEVGRRELEGLIREAGVDHTDRVDCQVFETGDYQEAANAMDEHGLVVLGANCPLVPTLIQLSRKPTFAVIKRAPPLRPWQTDKQSANWQPRLSPADYAELVQGLRHGSRLGADFITMLSLATIVASMGLLQNSPAVVIGSMLLAPLMTPMIGCGLALAQANQRLGNTALGTVAVGLLCTLAISYLVGRITPGAELTPQIYARGDPTVLDLVVAIASAAAAAYALARPNLIGSIAGVAIATALVPPLCSVGLSLAYRDTTNAGGAALLFATNFLAIVLSAAITFRLIGITAKQVGARQKYWVFRTTGVFVIALLVVCVPLQHALPKSLVETKPQPAAFPLTKSVIEALEGRLQVHPDAKLITAGRPSTPRFTADVIVVVGSSSELDPGFADELTGIIRDKMADDSLVVEVHCLNEQWQKRSE